jgi:hypothetical protein
VRDRRTVGPCACLPPAVTDHDVHPCAQVPSTASNVHLPAPPHALAFPTTPSPTVVVFDAGGRRRTVGGEGQRPRPCRPTRRRRGTPCRAAAGGTPSAARCGPRSRRGKGARHQEHPGHRGGHRRHPPPRLPPTATTPGRRSDAPGHRSASPPAGRAAPRRRSRRRPRRRGGTGRSAVRRKGRRRSAPASSRTWTRSRTPVSPPGAARSSRSPTSSRARRPRPSLPLRDAAGGGLFGVHRAGAHPGRVLNAFNTRVPQHGTAGHGRDRRARPADESSFRRNAPSASVLLSSAPPACDRRLGDGARGPPGRPDMEAPDPGMRHRV